MTIIEARTTVRATPESVFALAVDPDRATSLVEGLTEWRVLGSTSRGEGARFAATFKFGPATYEATLVVSVWDPPRRVEWVSESGSGQSLAWLLEPDGNGTSVLFKLGFEPPQGLAGAMFALTVEPVLRSRAAGTVAELKRQVEARRD